MVFTGMDKVRIENGRIIKDDPRIRLDFSSIAKGFTVDCLAELLEAEHVTDYMVEVGGEVRARGVNARGRTWRIGIDKPSFGLAGERETVIVLDGEAIATSGNYRNWFVDDQGRTRVHIIDPKTGSPALGEILSVSIVAPLCGVADAWATGLMACGTIANVERLLANIPSGTEYYIIHSTPDDSRGMAAFHSGGFPIADAADGDTKD
jgi:thiamine biosynthesis lipoprotein